MILEDSIQQQELVRGDTTVVIPHLDSGGYFSGDSLYHPEISAAQNGTAGDPIPYSVRGDDVLALLLLSCFVMAVIAFSHVRGFFSRQLRSFFYIPHEGTTEVTETASEVRFQLFIVFLTSLLLSLLYYFYTLHYIGDTFALPTQYHLIVIFLAVFLIYFIFKVGLYAFVNNVFFDGKRNGQWTKSLLFIYAIEGLLVFPAVIMGPYIGMAVEKVAIYVIFALSFVKLLTFYKCYIIFFRRNVFSLQIILYLCALEIVPLLALWGALDMTVNSLKINF